MVANLLIISRILLDLASYWLTYFIYISKQLFSHIASDATLKPLGHFAEATDAPNYPPIYAGEYVEQELSAINLKGKIGL